MKIKLDQIKPSANPIRTSWSEEGMDELTQSIKEQRQVAPIKVRPLPDGMYEIVYGHRRFEASQRAELMEVEVIIEDLDDTEALLQALVENVQREDMLESDLGTAYKLLEESGLTRKEISNRLGKSLTHIGQCILLVDDPTCAIFEDPDYVNMCTCLHNIGAAEKAQTLRGRFGDDVELRSKVAKKAINEGLSKRQIRQLADAIKAAPSKQAKEKLLEWEYSPIMHDPDRIKQRVSDYGAHDPIYRDPKPKTDQVWKDAPEVKAIIDIVTQWRALLKDFHKTAEIGKMSPEAKQFIAQRIQKLINDLVEYKNALEV